MSSEKHLLGSGHLLRWALAAWAEIEPTTHLHVLDVGQDRDYRFDLDALPSVGDTEATAFVAWGAQFLNFRRLELMGELKARGFRLPALVCRGALVAPDVVVGENCVVGAGAIVGSGCRLGYNSVVGAGCILGTEVQIGTSAWLADGVQVAPGVRIGAHATVGRGVILDEGCSVGRQSVLDLPGRRSLPVPDKTFITSKYATAVVIVDGGASRISASPQTSMPTP